MYLEADYLTRKFHMRSNRLTYHSGLSGKAPYFYGAS